MDYTPLIDDLNEFELGLLIILLVFGSSLDHLSMVKA